MGGRTRRDIGLHRRRRASRAGPVTLLALVVAVGLAAGGAYAARRGGPRPAGQGWRPVRRPGPGD
ncbi:hypothetical protein, partial [Micromonospora sp. ATA51]|uniref:hypothetical protein n=1 Tax=Micromonospora sp. ATA51 TaxID=2806098 RepID=UPI001A3C9C4D